MLALLALAALQAPADPGPLTGDWRVVNEAGGIAFDESRLTRDGDVIHMRFRDTNAQEVQGARYLVILLDYDCATHMATGRSMRTYRANGALVEELSEARIRETFARPPAGDARETLDAACHRTGWGDEGEEE
jgi:hypothetical protein